MLEPIWAKTLPEAGFEYKVIKFHGECTAEEINGLIAEGKAMGAKTVLGCGGGKVLDTGRAAVSLGPWLLRLFCLWRLILYKSSCAALICSGLALKHELSVCDLAQ